MGVSRSGLWARALTLKPLRSTLDSASTIGSSETPSQSRPHSVHKKLHLMVCPEQVFRRSYRVLMDNVSWPLGGQARRNST